MEKHVLWSALASALVLASCNAGKGTVTENELKGNWVEVMPANQQIVQGVTLEEGGKATSIGMATLKYERWKLTDGARLILEGKSIGNGQTIDFADTLDVVSLSGDTLTLGKGEMYRIQYVRQQEGEGLIGGSDAAMGYTWSKCFRRKYVYSKRVPVYILWLIRIRLLPAIWFCIRFFAGRVLLSGNGCGA